MDNDSYLAKAIHAATAVGAVWSGVAHERSNGGTREDLAVIAEQGYDTLMLALAPFNPVAPNVFTIIQGDCQEDIDDAFWGAFHAGLDALGVD